MFEYKSDPSTVERLAETLQRLDNHPEVEKCIDKTEEGTWIKGPGTEGFEELSEELQELLNDIDASACGELINNDGSCNWANHRKLKELGYSVTKMEGDSLGWLRGGIHCKNGIYVYG